MNRLNTPAPPAQVQEVNTVPPGTFYVDDYLPVGTFH